QPLRHFPREPLEMPCRGFRGAAHKWKILVHDGRINGIAKLAEPARRAVEQLHRIERFRFVELRHAEDKVPDRLMSEIQSGNKGCRAANLAGERARRRRGGCGQRKAAAVRRKGFVLKHYTLRKNWWKQSTT